MATERILILKLLTDLKQPVQSFAELERRVKTLKDVLKNTPNEGTAAFDKLAKQISNELNVSIDAAKNKIREFTKTATTEVQRGNDALKDYRKTFTSLNAADGALKKILAGFDALGKKAANFDQLNEKVKTLTAGLKVLPQQGTAQFEALAQVISGKLGISIDQARTKLAEFNRQATSEVRRGSNEVKEFTRTLRTVEPAAGSINALRQQVRSLAQEVDNLDRETAEFTAKNAELRRLNTELIRIEQTTQRGGRNVGNYATAFRGLAGTLSGVAGAFGVGFGIAGVTRIFRDGIDVFREFNQEIATLRAVSGASDEEIKELEEDAKRLGETTQFTAKQVAELKTNLARLGFNPKEINEATESILNLSIATQEDLAKSAKTVGQSIRAYGLEATEAGRVTDVLAESFNTSALQLETYREGFKLFAPVARQLKIPFEESAAALGLFADNGLEGTIATTSLATAFGRLVDPAGKAAKTAKKLGIEVFNSNGEFVGLAQLLKNTEGALEGFTDKQRLAAITQVFGQRAAKNFTTLLGAQRKAIVDGTEVTLEGGAALEYYTQQLEASEGAAKRAADTVGDTFNQDLLKLRSAIEGAAIQLVEANEGGLREFIQLLTRAVPVLADNVGILLKVTALFGLWKVTLAASNKETIIGSLVNKAYAASSKLLAGRLGLVTAAQRGLNTAFKANPVGFVITAIAALIFAFQELYNRSEAVRNFVDGITQGFRDFAESTGLAEKASGLLKKTLEVIGNIFTATRAILTGLVLGIKDFFTESKAGKAILDALQVSMSNTVKVIKIVFNFIKLLTTAVVNFVKENELLNSIVTKLGEGLAFAGRAIGTFLDLLSNTNAFIAGLRAEVKETLQDIERFFQVLIINAQIAQKQIEKLNPFGKTTEQLDEEIKKLRARRAVIGLEGRKFGEAFTEAYQAALALEKAEIEVEAKVTTTTDETPDAPTGGDDTTGGSAFNEENAKKQLTYLEQLQAEQRKLADEIKNLIAENKPYEEQLDRFKTVTAELTDINKEYNDAIKENNRLYQDGSATDYAKRISELQASQKLLTIDSDEYYNIQQQIINIERQRDSELENLTTRTQQYRQSLLELNEAIRTGDAEIGVTRAALDQLKQVEDAGEEGAKKIAEIQEQLNADLDQIARQRLNATRDALLSEIDILNAAQEQELQEAEGNEKKKEDIRRKYRRIRGEAELDLLENQKALLDLDFKQFEQNEKKKTDAAKKEADKRKQITDAAFQVANELNSAIFEILNNRQEQEAERAAAALDAEEERALRSADVVGATEEQKEEIRRRFEARREEAERELAKKQKRNAIIGSIINTALAVTKALATLPPPASFVTAGLTAALGAIQIATINAQQFALGGLFNQKVRNDASFGRGAHLKQGAYHSSGGMPIINPHTGRKVAEIEKDEVILNRRSMASKDVLELKGTPLQIAEQLNTYKGYGRSFGAVRKATKIKKRVPAYKKFQYKHGGRYGINQSIPKYASGAVFSSDIQTAAIQMSSVDPEQRKLTAMLVEEVRELRVSNKKAIESQESSAEALRRANQLVIDEENAS